MWKNRFHIQFSKTTLFMSVCPFFNFWWHGETYFSTSPRNRDVHLLFESMISEYLETASRLFGADYLKPKHHFLLHYPRIMKLMGPLGNISSMRYEAKHSQGKTVAKVSRNRVNVCRTIALKEAYVLNFRFLNAVYCDAMISGPRVYTYA